MARGEEQRTDRRRFNRIGPECRARSIAAVRKERTDGMAFARAWRERHRGVDWDAVIEAEARG